MRDHVRHHPVNWIDGMKINKGHFIAQDDAWKDALYDVGSLSTSPLRFGILPASAGGEENFNVKISLDNQNTLRVAVLACQAVTPGGIRINLPVLTSFPNAETDGVPALSFPFQETKNESSWWVVLIVHPYDKQPAGSPDVSENPPRYPYVLPVYTVEVINDSQYGQFSYHPYAITIGKLSANGNLIRVDQDYIPPCYSINASPDLVTLHAELDQFFSTLEILSSQIIQKIFKRNQQNEISELVMFLCDRIMLYLGQAITQMRWMMIHESPAALFASVVSLSRVMKNTIDLRVGSGKEEMLSYLSDWCDLKEGELETVFSSLANLRFDNNDINKNIQKISFFVRTTTRLFETLNKLEFIGKRKDTGKFITEEKNPKRRFFG
jgi:hypothetical protein